MGSSQKLVLKTHHLLLSTEIFGKRRKICPIFEEKPDLTLIVGLKCINMYWLPTLDGKLN